MFNGLLSKKNTGYYDLKTYNKLNLLFSLSYAHRKPIINDDKLEIYETLLEHNFRSYYTTKYYFENIIDNKYLELLLNNVFNNKININVFKNYMCIATFFHDFGKINYYFQNKQMNIKTNELDKNEKFFDINYIKIDEEKNKDKPSHSKYIEFICKENYLYDKKLKKIIDLNSVLSSFNIYSLFFNNEEKIIDIKDKTNELKVFFNMLSFCVEKHHGSIEEFELNISKNNEYNVIKNKNELLILLEIIFDIILFSDNMATGYFFNSVKKENKFINFLKNQNNKIDFDYINKELNIYIDELKTTDKDNLYDYINFELQKNIINDDLKKELENNFINNENVLYNKDIVLNNEKIDIIKEVFEIEKQLNEENKEKLLNHLKTITAKKFYNNLFIQEEKEKDLIEFNLNNFHFFKGTTGIGKTNISFLFIYKLLKEKKLNNVKMVFPLTTLINQYTEDCERTFQLKNINIDKYKNTYTNGIISCLNKKSKNEKIYNEKLNYKEYKYEVLNHRFPFLITSHVDFFDKLFSKNRLSYAFLHTLKNSCIILDEIQLYNDTLYEVIYNYLMYLSKLYNFKILIVSATLPFSDNEQNYIDENGNKIERFIFKEKDIKNRFIIKDDEINAINKCSIFERSVIVNKLLSENINNKNFEQYAKYFDKNTKMFKAGNEIELELIEKIMDNYFKNDIKQIGLITFNTIKKSKEIEEKIKELIKKNNLNVELRTFNNSISEIALLDLITSIKSKDIKKHILILATQKIDVGIDISVNFSVRYKTYLDNLFQNIGRLNRYMTYNKNNSLFFIIEDNNVKQPLFIGDSSFKNTHFKNKVSSNYFLNDFFNNDIETYYKELFDRNNKDQREVKYLKFNVDNIRFIHNAKMINNNYKPSKILINFQLKTIEEYFAKLNKNTYFDNTLKVSFDRINNFILKLFKSNKINDIDKFNYKIKNMSLSDIFDNNKNHLLYDYFNTLETSEKYNIILQIKFILKIVLQKFTIETTIPKNKDKDLKNLLIWNYQELDNEYFLTDYTQTDEKTGKKTKIGYEYKIEEELLDSSKICILKKNIKPIYNFENGFILEKNEIDDDGII